MIERDLTKKIKEASTKLGVISITGPRQSGKTTLSKLVFPNYPYYNLEDLTLRERIAQDPKGFIDAHQNGVIIDEIQRYPELLSFIQVDIDRAFLPGKFIITGSQNLLVSEKIAQTLAGRVAIFTLLPLSISELKKEGILEEDVYTQLLKGFYPRIYDQDLAPADLYPNYLATYVERDVRLIKNIGDLGNFQRFLQIIAGRVGQVLNLSQLGNDIGVTYKTIESWVSILEASYVAFRLEPYYENFGKRITKAPKIYFYDTGLACHLLGIDSTQELKTHSSIGSLFENMIIADAKKQILNLVSSNQVYFWRDSERNEIDLIVKDGQQLYPVEIKAGASFNSDYLKGIKVWESVANNTVESKVIYNGENALVSKTKFLNWKEVPTLIQTKEVRQLELIF